MPSRFAASSATFRFASYHALHRTPSGRFDIPKSPRASRPNSFASIGRSTVFNASSTPRVLKSFSAVRPALKLSLPVSRAPMRQRRLRRREPRARHAERRRRDVRQTGLVEELDRRRIAAVLAADPDLQVLARLAAPLDAHAHHGSDALAIEDLERVGRDDLLLHVAR